MLTRGAALLIFALAAPSAPLAQDLGTTPAAAYLRPEWTVERTGAGRAHVVGYLHNSNIRDAVNVWLRVEQITADGAVGKAYRGRVVGDVLSRGRMAFDVPVAEAEAEGTATYRVMVDTVDWVSECR